LGFPRIDNRTNDRMSRIRDEVRPAPKASRSSQRPEPIRDALKVFDRALTTQALLGLSIQNWHLKCDALSRFRAVGALQARNTHFILKYTPVLNR
jgi:hypothetical protein